jgi:hypothetical protein
MSSYWSVAHTWQFQLTWVEHWKAAKYYWTVWCQHLVKKEILKSNKTIWKSIFSTLSQLPFLQLMCFYYSILHYKREKVMVTYVLIRSYIQPSHYVHAKVSVTASGFMYEWMHICSYVCRHECKYVGRYLCMQACMFECRHVCMYVCRHPYMYVGIHICM